MASSNKSVVHVFEKRYSMPYNLTDEQISIALSFEWWVELCGSIPICVTGIVLNLTTIVIVLGSKLSANFFNWLVICLVIFDTNFLLVGILEVCRKQLGESSFLNYLFVYITHFYRSVILLCSEYMTILLALERYQALSNCVECRCNSLIRTRYNLKRYFALHKYRLIKYVGPVIVFASIFYIPKLMELTIAYQEICVNSTINSSANISEIICNFMEVITPTKLRYNDMYVMWYLNVTNKSITLVVPFVSLIYLNFNIFWSLKQHVSKLRLRRENIEVYEALNDVDVEKERKIAKKEKNMIQQTLMLFAIVILFLISHTPRTILNLEEWIYAEEYENARKTNCYWVQYWTLFLTPISHLLLQVNSMSSAFIYCIFNSLFREAMIVKCERSSSRSTEMVNI